MIGIARPVMGKGEIGAAVRVLKSGNLTQGEKVREFEKLFSSYVGVRHGIACSSGTTALQAGIEALGIREGDEVITTPFTFIATANAILYNRARPVFADIDEKTFNMDPKKVREAVTERTKAIVVVHLYGQPCDMSAMTRICRKNGLLLIEDCAQAHGAEFGRKKVGSFGDMSAFSFYATKNMVTGEGGMMLTGDDAAAELARRIVNQGQSERYDHPMVGFNYRMTEIQAAIGMEQLKKLDGMNARRTSNAKYLTSSLSGLGWLKTPHVASGVNHVWHQYTVRIMDGARDAFVEHMNSRGVGARVYYPKPVHMQPAYREMGYREGLCPVAESVSAQVASLPVHPNLKKAELKEIVEVVKSFR